MIQIKKTKMKINGVDDITLNVLPKLRSAEFHKALINGGLLESELENFAYMTGDRCLPYRMQDGYTRQKKEIQVDVVELENDVVKVLILPHQGGRVWSMYHKVKGKEILFCNPVLQPGNLAVRNAWVSGGIEWNLGQFGHSTLTMDRVYVAICEDETGREFVRLYEYERLKGLFLQVDLHLMEGDDQLYAHVTIRNPHKEDRSVYWWTNIAVELNRNCRVISGTREVIATTPINGENSFAHAKVPYLPAMPDQDGTYPENFMFSSEYFFQNKKDMKHTWEVAAYNDGTAFFERSTAELPYKKMFCWSNEQGGNHWQHFLATENAPLYVELQGGIIPTQVHGDTMPANSKITFTQAFGDMEIEVAKTHGTEYVDCMEYCEGVLEKKLSASELKELDERFKGCEEKKIKQILHKGSGYALIEEQRTVGFIPSSMEYELGRDDEAREWLDLLHHHTTPKLVNGYAKSYLTDSQWLPYLERAVETQDETAKFYYGVALYENGEFDKAIEVMKEYAEASREPIAYRTVGAMYSKLLDETKA
ncbi:MAG: DUF5107 domain-containing protein, partial [Eubacteriales bacterium]